MRNYILINLKDVGVNMKKEIDITKKLLNIVKNRNTPVIVNKQENSYVRNRKIIQNLAFESYSHDLDD